MFKTLSFGIVFAVLSIGFYQSSQFTLITAGVAIFMLGMIFMEGGFKAFSGGLLESILKKTTSTMGRSILSGFVSTSIVQSSSLISVITISFLSAELMGLREAVGILLGANIGSTTTAWLVSAFGLKIKISAYALPMLVFGVILKFTRSPGSRGVGDILLGLGLLFMGIDDMKNGFEAIKESIDLAQYAMEGLLGLVVYIFIGIVATVVIQSSGATMAIVIAALASGQITYENALALAIGSNIGTTVTAILGSLTSNENGKRLALAHTIFNIQTGLVAVILLTPLMYIVDMTASGLGIGPEDYAMKLSLFHTIFNIMGVLIMLPFVGIMVHFLNKRFTRVKESVDKPLYLNNEIVKIPDAAIPSLFKETEHLLDNAYVILAHGINVHRRDIYANRPPEEVIKTSNQKLPIDIQEAYHDSIKSLYSDIISFATRSQDFMDAEHKKVVFDIILANRNIAEAVKDVEFLQLNINKYAANENRYIRDEYNAIRSNLFKIYREIYRFKNEQNREASRLEMLKVELKEFDMIGSARLLELIKSERISNKMATSLMNDTSYAYHIAKNLIQTAELLWFNSPHMEGLSLEEEEREAIARKMKDME